MSDNAFTVNLEDQNEETQKAFADLDKAMAARLGFDSVQGFSMHRLRLAGDLMNAFCRQPQTPGSINDMAGWAVLAADVLMSKVAEVRTVKMGAPEA